VEWYLSAFPQALVPKAGLLHYGAVMPRYSEVVYIVIETKEACIERTAS